MSDDVPIGELVRQLLVLTEQRISPSNSVNVHRLARVIAYELVKKCANAQGGPNGIYEQRKK